MRRLALSAAISAALAGCADNPGPGLGAWLRASGAQFQTAALPTAEDGPKVTTLELTTNTALPGEIDKPLSGTLAPGATSVVLGLDGDRGTWLLPAGAPDVQAPDYPTVHARLSLSPDTPPGNYTLFARAGDEQGRLGPRTTAPLTVGSVPPPAGALVVSLLWDAEADLDLHVVDPDGVEIWKRDINSYKPPPPGEPVDPEAWKKGGILDFDSNAECVIDGRRREDVIWKMDAPKGSYVVRVDTFSLCAADAARWTVEVLVAGQITAEAHGMSTDLDTRAPHDRGAGVQALTFEVP